MSQNAVFWMLCVELGIFVIGLAVPLLERVLAGSPASESVRGEDRRSLALARLQS